MMIVNACLQWVLVGQHSKAKTNLMMATYKQALANCWVSPEVLCMEETQGMMTERRATNGVNGRCLDDLAQRKHVEIHGVQ